MDSQRTVTTIGKMVDNMVFSIEVLKKKKTPNNMIDKLTNDLYGFGIKIFERFPSVETIITYCACVL